MTITVETMSPKLAGGLWQMLALRDDGTAGTCWAWKLDKYRALTERRDDLESRIALDTARLRTGRG